MNTDPKPCLRIYVKKELDTDSKIPNLHYRNNKENDIFNRTSDPYLFLADLELDTRPNTDPDLN
jgi:hypothetical protein